MLEVHFDQQTRRFTIPVLSKQPVATIGEWPGWRRTANGTYYGPSWPSAVLPMLSPGVPLRWTEDAQRERDRIVATLHAAQAALRDRPPSMLGVTERAPKVHQRQAILALRHMGWRALLADDMGLGKTSAALWAIHDAQCKRLLVICPVSVKFNWQNEIIATLGDRWEPVVIDGGSRARANQLAEANAYSLAKNTAIIVNYDLLRHLSEPQVLQLMGWVKDNALIADESHYIKSRDAERTTLTHTIAAHAKHVLALTGTPIRNLADDLFSQVELVRPGTWTSYRDFAKRHLVIRAVKFGKRDVQKVVGTRNLAGLNAVMNTLQIKRAKSDAIDLPPKVHTFPELQLEGPFLKLYKAMADFARIEIRKLIEEPAAAGMTVFDPRAKSAVEQALRCEQLAQGFLGGIPDPVMQQLGDTLKHAEKIEGRPNELVFPNSPKLVWLLETIESVLAQGGAPIVFSRFNAPMFWLNQRLRSKGTKALVMHGGLSAQDKAGAITAFQERACDVLIVQVKIAEGWNATRSQDVLFLGRDWSPAINAQAEDRAHRMGQKGTVNVQVPIVRNTIEAMIHRRLAAKDADAQQALRNVTIQELMEAL